MAFNDRVGMNDDGLEPTPEDLLDLKDTLMLMMEDIMGLVDSIGETGAAADIRNGFEKLGGDGAIVAAYKRRGMRSGLIGPVLDPRPSKPRRKRTLN